MESLHLLFRFCSQPKQLRSPTWIQKYQRGDCFECATFLTSFLLGQGYNAFVVSGYASKEQTLCDLRRIPYPLLPQRKQPPPPPPVQPVISKYKLKPPTEYTSQFLAELEQQKQKKAQEKLRRREEEEQKLIEVIIFHIYFTQSGVLCSPCLKRMSESRNWSKLRRTNIGGTEYTLG